MAKTYIKIDKAGLQKVMQSNEVTQMTKDAGDRVASNVTPPKGECDNKMYQTTFMGYKSAVAIVALKHPIGKSLEAKHGSLRKGASAIGLKVTERGG